MNPISEERPDYSLTIPINNDSDENSEKNADVLVSQLFPKIIFRGIQEDFSTKHRKQRTDNSYPNLESLEICSKSHTEEQIINILSNHPYPEKLLSLHIEGDYFLYPLKNPVTEKTLKYISDYFPNITSLLICGIKIDNEKMSKLVLTFPLLKELSLGIVGKEALNQAAENLSAAMPKLQELNVYHGRLTDNALETFCRNCPDITSFIYCSTLRTSEDSSLIFPNESTLTDRSLKAIGKYWKNLVNLYVESQLFTWTSLKAFISSHPNKMTIHLPFNLFEIRKKNVEEWCKQYPFYLYWSDFERFYEVASQ